jgi:hypothetical protein
MKSKKEVKNIFFHTMIRIEEFTEQFQQEYPTQMGVMTFLLFLLVMINIPFHVVGKRFGEDWRNTSHRHGNVMLEPGTAKMSQ